MECAAKGKGKGNGKGKGVSATSTEQHTYFYFLKAFPEYKDSRVHSLDFADAIDSLAKFLEEGFGQAFATVIKDFKAISYIINNSCKENYLKFINIEAIIETRLQDEKLRDRFIWFVRGLKFVQKFLTNLLRHHVGTESIAAMYESAYNQVLAAFQGWIGCQLYLNIYASELPKWDTFLKFVFLNQSYPDHENLYHDLCNYLVNLNQCLAHLRKVYKRVCGNIEFKVHLVFLESAQDSF